jgi:GT2 family glycosyltransferase
MPDSRGGAPTATVEFGVVNYNGGEALEACVRSILAQEGPRCRVWVFDNASGDGSADGVSSLAGVEVVRSERNLGYAGALNGLLERMTADVVVLSNMDLEFEPGWAGAVLSALGSNPEADAVATLVVEDTDPPVVNSVGARFYGDLHAQNAGSGEPYRPEVVARSVGRAFASYGAVMCFRRSAVSDLAFDEDYFLFFEETDFFLRFHLLGRRTVFGEGAVARHRRSLSTRRYSPLKLYYGERNRLTTVFKLLPVWYWPVAMLYTLRRYGTLALRVRSGSDGAGGDGPAMPPARTIVWTLLRAWGAAVLRLPWTLGKRRRFWRRAPADPGDALALMRRYGLDSSELRVR